MVVAFWTALPAPVKSPGVANATSNVPMVHDWRMVSVSRLEAETPTRIQPTHAAALQQRAAVQPRRITVMAHPPVYFFSCWWVSLRDHTHAADQRVEQPNTFHYCEREIVSSDTHID